MAPSQDTGTTPLPLSSSHRAKQHHVQDKHKSTTPCLHHPRDSGCTSAPPWTPHTYFPRCVPWADGAQLDAQSPHPAQAPGVLQTFTRMEARGFSRCALPSPSAKEMSPAKELGDSTWHLKQLAPHRDWYSGCYKINCIFPGTKLEITQRAINAEICLCSAKISDKKPIRQFLPYVLEWIFFFFLNRSMLNALAWISPGAQKRLLTFRRWVNSPGSALLQITYWLCHPRESAAHISLLNSIQK